MQKPDKKRNPKGPKKNTESKKTPLNEPLRLNKYIAKSGICSRREADRFIEQGQIKVNGKIITELGAKVTLGDKVMLNGKILNPEKLVYVLLNKPKDCVTTVSDPHAKLTVMGLVKNACNERIYPVGRLDRNTTGVLLLTNDGELAKKLTHPSHNKLKVYHVFLDKNLTHSDFLAILEGIELDDGFIRPDDLSYISSELKNELGIELHSGRNRIVRRIFEHLGYKVIKLDRVYFAGLTKKNLPRGRWRHLTDKEVSMLKMGAYK